MLSPTQFHLTALMLLVMTELLLSLRTRQGEAIHSSVHVILLRRQKLDYFVAKLLVMTGCHVQPAQKFIAIQGQIGKGVQNDGKISLSHVVVKRSVLKKNPLSHF